VRRLLAVQFPQWADLAIEPVESAGTDNAIYRLGTEMAVRLPRVAWAVGQIEKESRWLPKLAPRLPLAIPRPLAQGASSEEYPWSWGVYTWLEGENPSSATLGDLEQTALDLAHFITVLQAIDEAGGPLATAANGARGAPLAARAAATRAAIASMHRLINIHAATAVWESALHAPVWHGKPVWLHGDLQSGNMLVRQGRLSAIIDFGCLGMGDPACDVMVAWTFLSAQARISFRAALGVDDATWARGRGWALSFGVIALPYYIHTNPGLAAIARRAIDEAIADV
jgi:aminoglycoside phosphotransferase (APT) family kinase protein